MAASAILTGPLSNQSTNPQVQKLLSHFYSLPVKTITSSRQKKNTMADDSIHEFEGVGIDEKVKSVQIQLDLKGIQKDSTTVIVTAKLENRTLKVGTTYAEKTYLYEHKLPPDAEIDGEIEKKVLDGCIKVTLSKKNEFDFSSYLLSPK
ncbi:hypothetical protein ScPMuIL_018613 [Solemya velum]